MFCVCVRASVRVFIGPRLRTEDEQVTVSEGMSETRDKCGSGMLDVTEWMSKHNEANNINQYY